MPETLSLIAKRLTAQKLTPFQKRLVSLKTWLKTSCWLPGKGPPLTDDDILERIWSLAVGPGCTVVVNGFSGFRSCKFTTALVTGMVAVFVPQANSVCFDPIDHKQVIQNRQMLTYWKMIWEFIHTYWLSSMSVCLSVLYKQHIDFSSNSETRRVTRALIVHTWLPKWGRSIVNIKQFRWYHIANRQGCYTR